MTDMPGNHLFRFERRSDVQPRLTIHAQEADATPIRPRLFGNFLEHLGFSIQGGILAQLLLNPTLTANHNVPPVDLARLRENGTTAERVHLLNEQQRRAYEDWRPHLRVTGFGLMILDDETAYGVPLPWKVEPHGAGAGNQPGRIGHSVVLRPAGGEAVLAQGIFPPHQRERTYTGYLWVKATGSGELRVALRRRSGVAERTPLTTMTLTWPGERWTKIGFTLTLPADLLRPQEPVDFCIIAGGDGQLWIDRAVLLPADHVDGLDPDLLEMIRWLAPPILRWPGGNFTSTYHFWDGIGPLDERQTYSNMDWGGIDDNFFGINEFLRLCELVETEPHLCVNIGNGTPEEAAAWVEYVNGAADTHWGKRRAADGHPEPYNVRLWEVGNEIYGPWQTGHCGPDENARRYRVWTEAMLGADPNLELLATGACDDFVTPHLHWHEALLRDGGEHLSCIALHALPNNFKQLGDHIDLDWLWQVLMAHPTRWEKIDLPELLALSNQLVPGRAIDVAITEWGILGDTQRPQVGNFGGAIYASLFLNMAIRQQEYIRVANATALLHGGCLRKAGPFLYYEPQTEVIRRYTQLVGGRRLPVSYQGAGYDVKNGIRTVPTIADVAWIDAIAVQQADSHVTIAMVNRHATEECTLMLALAGEQRVQPHTFEIMTNHARAMNTPLAPERVSFMPQPCPAPGDTITLQLPPRAIGWLQCTVG
jgi:alpha-N-arabinofuranosidase